jgi:hypothetical protein
MATASRQIDADDASATQSLRSLQDLIETQATSLRRMRRQAKRDQNSATSRGSRERRADEDTSHATLSEQGLLRADEIGARLSEWMRLVATSRATAWVFICTLPPVSATDNHFPTATTAACYAR